MQAETDSETYFRIVCDPGHDRTARELRDLPKEMRERVWADVTGDPTSTHYHIKPEDPDHVQQQLTALEHEIADISPKDAYEKALQINSQYVQDQALRLMFLRSEDFDAQDAAQRMVRHFDKKQELFGEDMLTKDIRLKDLTQDDLEALSCGGIQLLPQRDRAGRMIVFSRYLGFRYKSRTSMLRALWYLLMSTVAESVDVQQLGMVVVGYEVGEAVSVDYELIRQLLRVGRSVPIRFVASHSCYSDSPMQKVVDLCIHMVSSFTRLRLRYHFGSHQECQYRLLTMGIPIKALPILSDGKLTLDNHFLWLKHRAQLERDDTDENLLMDLS